MQIFEVFFSEEESKWVAKQYVSKGKLVKEIVIYQYKVFLLVDHEKRKIWKYFGPNSSPIKRIHATTLAFLINEKLLPSYKIDDLSENVMNNTKIAQEVCGKNIDKEIDGNLAKSIEEINNNLAYNKIL